MIVGKITISYFRRLFRILRYAYIKSLALTYDIDKCLQGFFKWSFRIVAMTIKNIYILQIHPFQTLVNTSHKMLP